MASNVIDRPANAGEDQLNMKAYADALTEFIANAQSPLTIALQGEWGSGKTSLMNALKASLVDSKDAAFLGIWINTWQYALMSDPAEAIQNILLGIIGQVSDVAKSTAEERISLFKKLARVGGGVASDILKKYSGIDVEKGLKEFCAGDVAPSRSGAEELKDNLAGLLDKALDGNKGKKGFIFFIDDLDRIDPPEAVQILELLKNIFDLEKCIFVLAIDYGVVVKGLKPKFGEMTTANEREFRSFFDKIIQLPFQMPVGSYLIDDFLIGSLCDIGYLDADDKGNRDLCDSLTAYALASVGTNPRSLKRLINTLSLIRLLIVRTQTKEDDADFKAWKDVTFALVCLQIKYPQIYSALERFPEFDKWGERFAQAMQLSAISETESQKLGAMEEFDEKWEQMLYQFCRKDPYLEASAQNISRILNRIKSRITGASELVGDTVQQLLRLSAVTSVKSEPENNIEVVNFNRSSFLKDLRWHTLGMREIYLNDGRWWDASLPNGCCIYSWQKRVQSNLECSLWVGRNSVAEESGDHITTPTFHICHDGKSFLLKIWGEFWGNWPKERYKGIDFNAESIQPDLAKTLEGVSSAWSAFGVSGNCGCNSGDYVGGGDIWWNVTIPFKETTSVDLAYEVLVSKEFSKKLRDSLVKLAESFAVLLPHRVPVNNNK